MPKLMYLDIHLVDPPELPVRGSMGDQEMQDLVDSITAIGQQMPCQVIRKNDRYEIRTGHRRLIACQRAGKPKLFALVYADGEDPGYAAMIAENKDREEVNRAQEAVFMAQLIEREGATEETLCKLVKRSVDYVADSFRLLRNDPLIFQAVLQEDINFSVARELNKCTDENHRRYLLDAAMRSGTSARIVTEWVRQWRGSVAQPMPQLAAPATDQAAPPVIPFQTACEFCGGSLDPYNLVSIFVHKWELQQIKQLLAQYARE